MKVISTVLAVTAPDARGFPQDGLPQIALAGRSNAGKSSLINALIGSKSLARSSSSPGKTRLINFYRVNDAFHLVDLPGFGYAKAGHGIRRDMESALRAYFDSSSPRGVVYLVDIRLPDSPVDHAALKWILRGGIPLLAVAAKSDKLKKSELKKSLEAIARCHGLPQLPLPVSSLQKTGLDDLWEQMGLLIFP